MGTGVISEISENDDNAGESSVRGALKKFPEFVVLYHNSRTYGNAFLITFKVGPLGTHTHLLIRSCHCWKHRWKAPFGTYRSMAVTFDLMSSMVVKWIPLKLRPIFNQKSLEVKFE